MTDTGMDSDLGPVTGKPYMVRHGDVWYVAQHPGDVLAVSRDWFDQLLLGPESVASRNGDVLTLCFDHVGGVYADSDGYTCLDDSYPPGTFHYLVLWEPVRWADLNQAATDLALAVAI